MKTDVTNRLQNKKGFTLTELLVVMALMVILAGIAIPSLTAYNRHARGRKSTENARQLFLSAQAGIAHYKASGLQKELYGMELLEIVDGDTSTLQAELLKKLTQDNISDADFYQATMKVKIDPERLVIVNASYQDGFYSAE